MDSFDPRKQDQGLIGTQVGAMIRRNVRKRFRNVYWDPTYLAQIQKLAPVVLIPNHFGWHDGYLMYLMVQQMKMVTTDWIEEFAAFPLFRSIGGLPFPKGDDAVRANTIRTTIRRMKSGSNLLLFAEGELHRGDQLRPFPDGLDRLIHILPARAYVPIAIFYDYSLHERPEATIRLGEPILAEFATSELLFERVWNLHQRLREDILGGATYPVLAPGIGDANERFGLKSKPR